MDNNIKQDAFMQGLELAAERYAAYDGIMDICETDIREAFKAGGKWMAQQIYNTIKGMAENNPI